MNSLIKIMVVCEKHNLNMYFSLFKLMLGGKVIQSTNNKYLKEIITDEVKIEFAPPTEALRGKKVHFILHLHNNTELKYNLINCENPLQNLLQDKEEYKFLFE